MINKFTSFTGRKQHLLKAPLLIAIVAGLVQFTASGVSHGHGDVQPQAVDTEGLEPTGEEFLEENPYRLAEVISGGIAPDLRTLEDGIFGDEWFLERVRKGYSQNGAYKMPPFQELLRPLNEN